MTRRFAVWAPNAERVELVHGERLHPMERAASGWHERALDARIADDYAFSLDGGEPRPDPRSLHQPQGVHGPSRIVEPAARRWSDSRWRGFPLGEAVIYELHAGTFSDAGTFDGVIEHLDHIVDLGANAIELMPVATFAGERGWGYDGVDLYAPHPAYGGPEALCRLVDACHRRGVAVIVDVVYNHVGPEGNYLPEFGPYFTDSYATPWGSAVNYDGPDSDQVRAFVVDNALMWLRDYHCDGLRLDAVHAIVDTSAVHIVEEVATRVHELGDQVGRHLWVMVESDANDPRVVTEPARGGYGADAQWSDNFHHALHAALTGDRAGYYADFGSLSDVCTALSNGYVYTGQYSRYRRRRFGRDTDALPLTRFLGYSQNHDQVGNRAAGERLCHLVSPERAKIAAALTLLSPFVPLLFQGEEWAASTPFQYFTDLGDPTLQLAVSRGRREEFAGFGWRPEDVPDPQDPATFARSKLRWEERAQPAHAEMLDLYRRLIAIRRETPGMHDGDRTRVHCWCDEDRGILRYRCCRIQLACNLGPGRVPVDTPAACSVVVCEGVVQHDADVTTLGPDSMVVWRHEMSG